MVTLVENDDIQIEKFTLGFFGTNAYVIICRKTRDSVLIDTPADAGTIIEKLKVTNLKYILLTHNHMDHIGALSELQLKTKVPVAVHASDAKKLPSPPEILLNDGDIVSIGHIKIEVLHTPGHTPGSLCFNVNCYLISGDTIFPGGPGKTNSPADFRQIIKSLTEKIFILPDDTQIYPGHGEPAVLSKEKDEFAVFSSRPHHPNLCGDVLWLSS